MIVLVVLFGSWLILRGIGALGVTTLATWHDSVRYALAVMFVFTGVAHFNKMRRDLAQMIPSFFPQPMLIVFITGVVTLVSATKFRTNFCPPANLVTAIRWLGRVSTSSGRGCSIPQDRGVWSLTERGRSTK